MFAFRAPQSRVRGAAVGVAAVAALLLAGCSGSAEPAEKEEGALDQISISRAAGGGFQAVMIADEQGIFEKHGIEATIEVGAGEASKQIPLVVSGDFDFTMSSAPDILRAQQSGIPVRMVASVQNAPSLVDGEPTDGVVVAPGSSISSWEDLEGKTIGIGGLGNLPQIVNSIALEEHGVDPASVTYVALPNESLIDAALAGQVDAILPVALFHTVALDKGFTALGGGAAEFFPGASQITWVASEKMVTENADLVERFVAAMAEASEFANENPDVVRDVDRAFTKMPEDFIATRHINPLGTELARDKMEKLISVMTGLGFLEKKLDVADVLWKNAPGA